MTDSDSDEIADGGEMGSMQEEEVEALAALISKLVSLRGYDLTANDEVVLQELPAFYADDGSIKHNDIRNLIKKLHILTSQNGSHTEKLEELLKHHFAGFLADHCYALDFIRERRADRYAASLDGVSLSGLACTLLSESQRQAYSDKGWLQIDLKLTALEVRMLTAANKVRVVELGVDAENPDTFCHAQFRAGMDFGYGWLRVPTGSLQSQYLNSHPRFYATMVGIYAFELVRSGAADDAESVRACIELRSQAYNSKLHFPGDLEHSFNHLDCDYTKGNVGVPAPQSLVALSPNKVGDDVIYRVRFVNINTPEHQSRIKETMVCGGTSFEIPRKATTRPEEAAECPRHVKEMFSSGSVDQAPDDIKFGDLLVFNHLVAHDFSQFRVRSEIRSKWESIRQAEVPFLMSPRLHGVLHQSTGEVVSAFATGKAPAHWPHLYTGNRLDYKAAAHLEPLIDAIPCPPFTMLGRCIAGIDEWDAFPATFHFICRIAKRQCDLEEGLKLPLAEHRHVCAEKLNQLRERLVSLSGDEEERSCVLGLRLATGRAWTASSLHPNYQSTMQAAATRVLGELDLWAFTDAENQGRAADRAMLVSARDAILESQRACRDCADELMSVVIVHSQMRVVRAACSRYREAIVAQSSTQPTVGADEREQTPSDTSDGMVTPSRGSSSSGTTSSTIGDLPSSARGDASFHVPRRRDNMVYPTCGSDSAADFLVKGFCSDDPHFCVVRYPTSGVVSKLQTKVDGYISQFDHLGYVITRLAWQPLSLGTEVGHKRSRDQSAELYELKPGLRIVGHPLWCNSAQRNRLRILISLTTAHCVIIGEPFACIPTQLKLEAEKDYRQVALVDDAAYTAMKRIAGQLTTSNMTSLVAGGKHIDACKKVLSRLQSNGLLKLPAGHSVNASSNLDSFLLEQLRAQDALIEGSREQSLPAHGALVGLHQALRRERGRGSPGSGALRASPCPSSVSPASSLAGCSTPPGN